MPEPDLALIRDLVLPNADATDRLGKGLAAFPRAEDVPSPTSTPVQTYGASSEIWHADLSRLTHPDGAVELGLEDTFETAISQQEWPERLAGLQPPKALRLKLSLLAQREGRCLQIIGNAQWAEPLEKLGEC